MDGTGKCKLEINYQSHEFMTEQTKKDRSYEQQKEGNAQSIDLIPEEKKRLAKESKITEEG